MRARSTAGVSRHAGNAAAADSTASSTIPAAPIGTSAMVSPRDGLKTGEVATPEGVRHSPSIRTGQAIIKKLQAPSTKLQRSSKHQTSNCGAVSLTIHAGEDQVELFGFTIQGAGLIGQSRLSGGDEPQKMSRFFDCFDSAEHGAPAVVSG